jgi:hypothetical protein
MNAAPAVNPFLSSPVLWVALAGLLLGAAAASATARTRNRPRPERARTRKWVLACLLLSTAVVAGLLAVFVPGPRLIMEARLAWLAAAAALVSFCALRFTKTLGITVSVLLLAVVIVFGLFLRGITAFTGETEVAAVRVVSVDDGSMRLSITPRGQEPALITMKGSYFAPIVKVVIFDDLFVFMGARTWYRFEGLTSFNQDLRQQDTDYRFARAAGISETLWRLFEANEGRIPGVKTVQIEMTLKKARELTSYGIRVQNDGGVEVVPLSGT